MICDKPSHRKSVQDSLRRHYLKLLGYSTGQYFFHVTYDFTGKQQDILDYLRVCAQKPPDGFAFERHEEIKQSGTLPRGLVTRYRRDGQDVAVVFLVLDIGQSVQSGSAAQAGAL